MVLQTTDLKTFTFASDLGYNFPVLSSPVSFTQCDPTYDTTFDENYAAPGSVLHDPTLPAGNLIMLYDTEQHCTGGVSQFPFYLSVGFARSSDNGRTWRMVDHQERKGSLLRFELEAKLILDCCENHVGHVLRLSISICIRCQIHGKVIAVGETGSIQHRCSQIKDRYR